MPVPVFGIVGWKNNGKTTLMVKLVEFFVGQGFKVATVKHAHHDFDIDHEGTDSWRHRQAGAGQVAVVSSQRWALIHENESMENEPALDQILCQFAPCDLVLVEGYKHETHAKLEVRRTAGKRGHRGEFLSQICPNIVAIAYDDEALAEKNMPAFALDNIASIANFIKNYLNLERKDLC